MKDITISAALPRDQRDALIQKTVRELLRALKKAQRLRDATVVA